MDHLDLIVFGLLLATATLAVLARLVHVPYPIALVLGGAGIGFVPGVPELTLDPDLVLLIFLPPLLYGAAFFTSLRDLRRNARPILLLAIGVVIATMVSVAVVAHEVIGMGWAEAFVLGAIVSPTDAVAPSEILRRLGVPFRMQTVIEGENLTNDWSALVLYRVAVAAVVSGSFTLWEAGLEFIWSGVGGLGIGLLAGVLIRNVRQRIDDPPIEFTISLLSGYAAYLPAEALGVSGVIAAVTVGIYMGWHTPELTTPVTRLQGQAIWEVLTFLVNAVLFLLIGLQLPSVIDGISGHTTGQLVGWGLLISAVVILTRLIWQFTMVYVIRALDRREVQRTRRVGWRMRLVGGWAGMRGAVSLAAALALPADFPARDQLLFITFGVILATLVLQGLTLPAVIRWAGLHDDGAEAAEELLARRRAAEAALARIDELEAEQWPYEDTLERMRGLYRYRIRRLGARAGEQEDGDGTDYEHRSRKYQKVVRTVLDAQHHAVVQLRNEGQISNDVMHRIERELDLEDERLEI